MNIYIVENKETRNVFDMLTLFTPKQINMKQYFKSVMAIALVALSTSVYAGDTYESSEAKCKITFPSEYEAETVTF